MGDRRTICLALTRLLIHKRRRAHLQPCPRFLENEECPHYTGGPE
jgi:hypothetical protein